MIKNNSYEALTFVCNKTIFNDTILKLLHDLNYHVVNDVYENGIYTELVISKKNILEEVNRKLTTSKLNYFEYDDFFVSMLDNLLFLILNTTKNVLFIVSSNTTKLQPIIKRLNLEPFQLIDSHVNELIYSKELTDLIEVGFKYSLGENDGIMSLSVGGLPQNESILESIAPLKLKDTEITKYTRAFSNYRLEIESPNLIKLHNFNEYSHIAKVLSKSILKE